MESCAWAQALVVVNFDLNLGQTVELVFPYATAGLPSADLSNLANLSFPDSTAVRTDQCSLDLCYGYRFRDTSSNPESFHYAVSYFRQRPDLSVSRGYLQKSLVVVSKYPFFTLFESMMNILGPLYFDNGVAALEAGWGNLVSWPFPSDCLCGSSRPTELPFLGEVVDFYLADVLECPLSKLVLPKLSKGFENHIKVSKPSRPRWVNQALSDKTASFRDVNIYTELGRVLGNLWALWEIAMCGEPLMIVGASPRMTCRTSRAVMSLISPLPYLGDYRPYFTVMESDFQHFEDMYDHKALSSCILGITNPFFLKRFCDFNTILLIGLGTTTALSADSVPSTFSLALSRKTSREENIQKALGNPDALLNSRNDPRLISKYPASMSVNKDILSKLLNSKDKSQADEFEISQINNVMLREHFNELTSRFLAPFELFLKPRYVEVDIDQALKLERQNPYLFGLRFPRFEEDKFLDKISEVPKEDIKKHFCFKTSTKTSLIDLYRKFFRSPHFLPWFNMRKEESRRSVDTRVLSLILEVDDTELLETTKPRELGRCAGFITALLQKCLVDKCMSSESITLITLRRHLEIITDAQERLKRAS